MSPAEVPAELAEKAANGFLSRLDLGDASPREVQYMQAALAAVLPEAMAEAWEMGRDAGFDTGNEYGQGHEFPVSTDNPYREGSPS